MRQQMNQYDQDSTGEVLQELVSSSKELIRNELILAKEELKLAAGKVASHSVQAAAFGALLALSVLPFLAFLVIGIGELLGGLYWLSSLLVALVCAGLGGFMAWRAVRKITEEDLRLPHIQSSLEREARVLRGGLEEVRNATKRRAV